MPFVKVPGLTGKVYVPEGIKTALPKKHPCKDCFACEFCSNDRCNVCRQKCPPPIPSKKRKKSD